MTAIAERLRAAFGDVDIYDTQVQLQIVRAILRRYDATADDITADEAAEVHSLIVESRLHPESGNWLRVAIAGQPLYPAWEAGPDL